MPKNKTVYDIIKRQNGEHFAKAIRNYDSGIFDIPNLPELVKYAGRDAEPIMMYLVSLKHVKINELAVHADPIELLARAGYDAYVADTLEKQNAIRKYFARGEALCTFNDEYRYQKYYIINAVRHDIDKIVRPTHPSRQDEYGTSVISIQILKSGGFISIKNRYNHVVENPDNTFGSNPDNIIEGLSDALKAYFKVDFAAHYVDLPNGYTTAKNHIVKYNQEINNIYYGKDFYVQDGEVIQLDNATELLLGNGLLLNLQAKRVFETADETIIANSINKQIENKTLSVKKSADGTKSVFADSTHVLDVKNGLMTWFMPLSGDKLLFNNLPLKGYLDFSGIRKKITVNCADFHDVTGINFGGQCRHISLHSAKGLHGHLDFSCAQAVELAQSDLKNVNSITFGPNTKLADLSFAENLHCALDFSNVLDVNLLHADLSNVPSIKFRQSGGRITLRRAKGLTGDLVFGAKSRVELHVTDLGAVTSIKFGPKSEVYMNDIKNLSCPLDLSETSVFEASYADFTKVPWIKFNSHAKFINLDSTRGLSGNLDFSKVSEVILNSTNLSRVTGINFNPTGVISGLDAKSCKEWTARFIAAQTNNTIALAHKGHAK